MSRAFGATEPADHITLAGQGGDRWNVLRLHFARAARGFGDGFAAIILPAYLTEIGYSPLQIGMVATAALSGSAVMTLVVGFFAPGTICAICFWPVPD
jgi:MFS family permease